MEPAVGILAACMADSSVVDGCWATGTVNVNASGTSRYAYIGGLVGTNGVQSLVCNSWADVQIAVGTGCTEAGAGGIVGWTANNSAVINCAAFGSIENNCNAQMMYGAGGIAGYSSGAIYACYSDMTLHADAQSYEDGADVSIGGASPAARLTWLLAISAGLTRKPGRHITAAMQSQSRLPMAIAASTICPVRMKNAKA